MQKFYSHGKLLITGEYVVLDGATALALPTKFGQSLEVETIEEKEIHWKSFDHEDQVWFEEQFQLKEILNTKPEDFQPDSKNEKVSKMLFLTLHSAAGMKPELFSEEKGYQIITKADFPLDWGLGTSSTLIANLAKWLEIDAFKLLDKTFGGSGYDVAVALEGHPVTYELHGENQSILSTSFDPDFKDQLFFVHLNRKQNSRDSIKKYREQNHEDLHTQVEKISSLTHKIITCTDFSEFKLLLEIHENVISQVTGLKKVKNELFPDYSGAIKSLGGWGGDFVLATGGEEQKEYFRNKGYNTIVDYKDMIL
ncbi:MAG: GYDIA family GHMP kinase [Salinimicrobium sp.]